MNTSRSAKRSVLSTLLMMTLLGSGLAAGGCAYGGIATAPDGSIIVARNSLLGAARKIYVCKLTDNDFKCVETLNPP
jgi:hypothetical protein